MSLILPVTTFRITHDRIPNIIPVAIEYANGIIMIAKKPPTVSAISVLKSIFVMFFSINRPTNTRAGAVANDGIARKIGYSGSASKNRIAEVKAEKMSLHSEALDKYKSEEVLRCPRQKECLETAGRAL